jgi:hypothetical protein
VFLDQNGECRSQEEGNSSPYFRVWVLGEECDDLRVVEDELVRKLGVELDEVTAGLQKVFKVEGFGPESESKGLEHLDDSLVALMLLF